MNKREVPAVVLFVLLTLLIVPAVPAQQIQVPNVVNMDAAQASQLLLQAGLKPIVSAYSVTGDQRLNGKISAQSPGAGQKAGKNSIVYLTSYQYQQPAPTIKLTSPKQSDRWTAGTTQTVKWTYTGTPPSPNMYMMLYRGGAAYILGGNFAFMQPAVPVGKDGSGSYNWAVPSNLPEGNDYQLCVGLKTGAPVSTCSDKFSIAVPPTITLLSPAGGESYKVGTVQTVKWKYTGDPGPRVYVIMCNNGKILYSLGEVSVGSGGVGSFNWTPQPRNMGKNNQIKVLSTSNPSVFAMNTQKSFTVWMAPPTLKFLSPTRGDKFKSGETITVKWSYSLGSTLPDEYAGGWYNWNFSIALVKSDQIKNVITYNWMPAWKEGSNTTTLWTGSASKSGDDYMVVVSAPGYINEKGEWASVTAYSDRFSISLR